MIIYNIFIYNIVVSVFKFIIYFTIYGLNIISKIIKWKRRKSINYFKIDWNIIIIIRIFIDIIEWRIIKVSIIAINIRYIIEWNKWLKLII